MNIQVIWNFCGKPILFIFVLKHINPIWNIGTNSITTEIKSLLIGALIVSDHSLWAQILTYRIENIDKSVSEMELSVY